MFGFLEGGRGIVDTIVAFSALGVFVMMGSGAEGLKSAILFYSAINIAAGLLCWFLLSDARPAGEAQATVGLAGLLEAARVPGIWLVSLNVFMVYVVYCGLTYFIPYLKDMYELPVALVGAYGIINQYFLEVLGGPAGGFLADKTLQSSSRYLKWAFVALLPVMAAILARPTGSDYIYAAMAATLSFAFIVFTMRGVFWAPMSEVGVPSRITGSAFGIGCLIGYAPGMFAHMIYGAILDHFPGPRGRSSGRSRRPRPARRGRTDGRQPSRPRRRRPGAARRRQRRRRPRRPRAPAYASGSPRSCPRRRGGGRAAAACRRRGRRGPSGAQRPSALAFARSGPSRSRRMFSCSSQLPRSASTGRTCASTKPRTRRHRSSTSGARAKPRGPAAEVRPSFKAAPDACARRRPMRSAAGRPRPIPRRSAGSARDRSSRGSRWRSRRHSS